MNVVIPEIIREKKVLVGILIGLIIVGSVMTGWVFLKKQRGEFLSPLSQVTKKEEEPKILLWDDPAGFTFEYPEGLYIDPQPQDLENYAHLEITSTKDTEGRIIILVSDAPTKTIEEWVKEAEQTFDASIIDTTLAQVPAKKLLLKDPKKILTAALDPYGGLFLLELEFGEGEFWQKVYEGILKSFAFKPLTKEEKKIVEESGGVSGGNESIIYMEEEVIE